jgi:hypothetical protein
MLVESTQWQTDESGQKPILTAERKVRRMQWCTDWKCQLKLAEPFYSAFLDEKWFYTKSRREKQKVFPMLHVNWRV